MGAGKVDPFREFYCMEVGKWMKMAIFERYLLLEGPIFDFHDYGRKCRISDKDCKESVLWMR